MYHGKHLKKLGRKTSKHRMDMLQNMVSSLIKHGRIETTLVKAKSMQRLADKMVTYIKDGSVHSENICRAFVREHDITIPKLKELAERFRERPGGYTRVLKSGNRHGDNAPMGIIEYIGEPDDLRAFFVIRAEARRRLEQDKGFKSFEDIHEFLKTCQSKGTPLDKSTFLRLKSQQKAMRDFERRVEKVKVTQNFTPEAWESIVEKEMELLSSGMKSLELTQ